jgi:hypothetical protein
MKNKHTLLIATILLVLCVIQKEARYKAMTGGNVEKIYNAPSIDKNGGLFNFASVDSTSEAMSSAKLLNNNLLNISASSKILNN